MFWMTRSLRRRRKRRKEMQDSKNFSKYVRECEWKWKLHKDKREKKRNEKRKTKKKKEKIANYFNKCKIRPWRLQTNKQTNHERNITIITIIITRSAKCFLPCTFIYINLFNFTDRCKRKKTKRKERTYMHSSYIFYWPFFVVSHITISIHSVCSSKLHTYCFFVHIYM